MKTPLLLFFSVFLSINAWSQHDQIQVRVQDGDGIFSLLRRHGLNPGVHYASFVKLNSKNIKNGSELYLDRLYILPKTTSGDEVFSTTLLDLRRTTTDIIDNQLEEISPKSERLKNAVIHLLAVDRPNKTDKIKLLTNEILLAVANKLMLAGAKVYIYQENQTLTTAIENLNPERDNTTEISMGVLEQMGTYVDQINGNFLRNQGKYQRILAINLDNSARNGSTFDISIFHHDKSEMGARLANNIQQIFNKHSLTNQTKDYTEVFKNNNNLYLANNALPAITLIDIGDSSSTNLEERISIKSDKIAITSLITSGVLNDYSNISLEN
jgi:N-acetylmuramoyl-L-alanine amidase